MTGSTEVTMPAVNAIDAFKEEPYSTQINSKMWDLFRKTKAKGLNDEECAMALELARSLGLNPWANEFFASKGQGRNGREGQLLIMVGRDGLLRKAEDFPDYRGYDSDVVYEKDDFQRVEPDAGGQTLRARAGVVHVYGHPAERGKIVGAWAVAERAGRPPRFFYAPLDQYMPEFDEDWKLKKSPWGNQLSVMIEKVPISVVHRTLCNLSGVYLPEELARLRSQEEGAAPGPRADEEQQVNAIIAELDCDLETRRRLQEGVGRLNVLSPGSWGLAKVQMTLPGRSAEELIWTAAQIEADIQTEEARQGVVTSSAVEEDGPVEEEPAAAEGGEPEPEAEPAPGEDAEQPELG